MDWANSKGFQGNWVSLRSFRESLIDHKVTILGEGLQYNEGGTQELQAYTAFLYSELRRCLLNYLVNCYGVVYIP